MKKIPCLFERDFTTSKAGILLQTVTPGCEWVLGGEGVATRKYDGTSCAIIGGEFFKRYDAKQGKEPPGGAIPCAEPDPITGHWPHWVKVDPRKAEDRYHALLWQEYPRRWGARPDDGTYEMCGPKVGTNAECLPDHALLRHGEHILHSVPRTFDGMRNYLGEFVIEGIVFHHPDGRMVKIRRHDFGLPW